MHCLYLLSLLSINHIISFLSILMFRTQKSGLFVGPVSEPLVQIELFTHFKQRASARSSLSNILCNRITESCKQDIFVMTKMVKPHLFSMGVNSSDSIFRGVCPMRYTNVVPEYNLVLGGFLQL